MGVKIFPYQILRRVNTDGEYMKGYNHMPPVRRSYMNPEKTELVEFTELGLQQKVVFWKYLEPKPYMI